MVRKLKSDGFTIVELLIVVVVIAILAAITIVAYNGIQEQALNAALREELATAAKQMQIAKINNGTYPEVLPDFVQPKNNISLSLGVTDDPNKFCINGYVKSRPSIQKSYATDTLQDASLCDGATYLLSERGAITNIITDPKFTDLSAATGWSVSTPGANGMTVTTRSGTSGDPIPTSPVLVVSNPSVSSNSWAILTSKAYDLTKIKAGKTYLRSFYARKTNYVYTGSMLVFAISDTSNLNAALSQYHTSYLDTTWKKFELTATAAQDAIGSNVVYQSLNAPDLSKSGWAIELQGYRLYEL